MMYTKKAFVVLNPVAGNSDPAAIRGALAQHLGDANWSYEIYETTGKERIADVIGAALDRGFDMCLAAGGDGTVSGVAGGLVHSAVPLGIIPVGTGNTLARDLGIPVGHENALGLLIGEHEIRKIDAMRIDERYFVQNIGIGISAQAVRDTNRDGKRRFGRVVYLWSVIGNLFGFQPRRFTITVDGYPKRLRASEVTIANSGAFGEPYLRWGAHIRLNDARIDVCIAYARNLFDYLKLTWDLLRGRLRHAPNMRYMYARRSVTVDAAEPLLVHADGELVGHTPVHVHVVPQAVAVIVPPERANSFLNASQCYKPSRRGGRSE